MLKENRFRFSKVGDYLIDKALEAFVIFPFNPSYIDQIIKEIGPKLFETYNVEITHNIGSSDLGLEDSIDINSKVLGSFSKKFTTDSTIDNPDEVKSVFYCVCSFTEDPTDVYANCAYYSSLEENDKDFVDYIAQCVVPFYITNGKYKSFLPLLINIMPEFIEVALTTKGL